MTASIKEQLNHQQLINRRIERARRPKASGPAPVPKDILMRQFGEWQSDNPYVPTKKKPKYKAPKAHTKKQAKLALKQFEVL